MRNVDVLKILYYKSIIQTSAVANLNVVVIHQGKHAVLDTPLLFSNLRNVYFYLEIFIVRRLKRRRVSNDILHLVENSSVDYFSS